MKSNGFGVILTSEEPDRLRAFYRDVVGLTKRPDMGDNAFDLGGATLFIQDHSDTKGPAKEPHRYISGMFVDDVKAEQDRLEALGVKFVPKEGREEWGGIMSTFVDPDGNYMQIIGMGS
jgi:predicted enzyme related to lactoylglutathione lyase